MSTSAIATPKEINEKQLNGKLPPLAEEGLKDLPLSQLRESPWNPRKYFAEGPLSELAQSIQAKGITTPIIVRPRQDETTGDLWYEIGAGARRSRAAKLAGLTEVPCIVRHLDDEAFLELVSFENGQREDPHPLEESAGFRNYMEHTGKNVDAVAARAGVSRSQVYARLKLKDLIEEAERACWDGKITAGHAILIARLQPKEQLKALKYIESSYHKPSVRDLESWIHRDICLEMGKAQFRLDDPHLIPDELKHGRTIEGPGACTTCPKRSSNSPDLFPELQPEAVRARVMRENEERYQGPNEKYRLAGTALEEEIAEGIASADVCTDPACFKRKLQAHLVQIENQAKAKSGEEVLRVSSKWNNGKDEQPGRARWDFAEASDPQARKAVIVDGEDAGKLVTVKVKPPRRATPEHDWEAERQKREEALRREAAVRRRVLTAVLAKVTQIDRDDIIALITARFDGWQAREGAKVLAECLGVPKGAANGVIGQLPKWHGKDLGKALVGALVVEDLTGSDKGKDLLAAAKRYKVDAAKIRAEFEAEEKKKAEPAKKPEAPKAAGGAVPKKKAPAAKAAPAKKKGSKKK